MTKNKESQNKKDIYQDVQSNDILNKPNNRKSDSNNLDPSPRDLDIKRIDRLMRERLEQEKK